MIYTPPENITSSGEELLSLINDMQHHDSGNSSDCSFSSSCSSSCNNKPTTSSYNDQSIQVQFSNTLKKAPIDYKLLNDSRLVKNLLDLEDYYRIQANYFQHVQTEIKPWMRKMLATWMLDVCKNQSREEDVFVLAMNILDRFLSVQQIGKRHLQLLGTVCMFIAAKLRSAVQFSAQTLVIYTANSITIEELLNWEQFVLHKLKWDICAVTPNDFLPHLLKKFDMMENQIIRKTFSKFVALCATDFRFSMIPSSMIASSCFFCSVKSLNTLKKQKGVELLTEINIMTSIDLECLKEVIEQIEDLVEDGLKIELSFIDDTSAENEINYDSNMEIIQAC